MLASLHDVIHVDIGCMHTMLICAKFLSQYAMLILFISIEMHNHTHWYYLVICIQMDMLLGFYDYICATLSLEYLYMIIHPMTLCKQILWWISYIGLTLGFKNCLK